MGDPFATAEILVLRGFCRYQVETIHKRRMQSLRLPGTMHKYGTTESRRLTVIYRSAFIDAKRHRYAAIYTRDITEVFVYCTITYMYIATANLDSSARSNNAFYCTFGILP